MPTLSLLETRTERFKGPPSIVFLSNKSLDILGDTKSFDGWRTVDTLRYYRFSWLAFDTLTYQVF